MQLTKSGWGTIQSTNKPTHIEDWAEEMPDDEDLTDSGGEYNHEGEDGAYK